MKRILFLLCLATSFNSFAQLPIVVLPTINVDRTRAVNALTSTYQNKLKAEQNIPGDLLKDKVKIRTHKIK